MQLVSHPSILSPSVFEPNHLFVVILSEIGLSFQSRFENPGDFDHDRSDRACIKLPPFSQLQIIVESSSI